MSQKARARELGRIGGLSYQQALVHLQNLKLGPKDEVDYVEELSGGASVELDACTCGREYYVAFDAENNQINPKEYLFGEGPKGDPNYVSDLCPRCSLVYKMIEWFFENYEDPANGVPYDGGEGGYIYVNGGPHDPNDVLQDEFPGLEYDLVAEACEKIYPEGYEWVLKGDH